MKKQKRTHLYAAICFMLITVMTTMVWAEPAQAAKIRPQVHTMDVYSSLTESMPIRSYGKVTANAGPVNPNWMSFPEGATVYVADSMNTCEGLYVYRVYYEGQAYTMDSKYITDLKNTTWSSSWINKYKNKDKVKVQKTAVAGNVLDPNHYYYIYSKPSAKPKNCIGAISAGATVQVVKENYNSKWAKVMCTVENTTAYGYMQRAYLNTADSYLAGVNRNYQQSIKLAKKAKIAYSGILKNYWNYLTKKEFCRLAVNWYKATGHKLPKQRKKSPYTDTKDKYVIMAHQLGIVKSTSSKKFNPNKVLSEKEFNTLLKRLVKVAGESKKVYTVGEADADACEITRQEALYYLYRAYQATKDTDYLVTSFVGGKEAGYTISPADNLNICLDVYNCSMDRGAEIGLYEKNGGRNQVFCLRETNGFLTIYSNYSKYVLTGTTEEVYQDAKEYESQKTTIKYNNDGTVCIVNGNGLYLDIQGGKAVSGAKLIFAPKSGKSSQKFVFN